MAKSKDPHGPAKAGRRKLPANKGKHTTTPEMRKRARWLSTFGFKYFPPIFQTTNLLDFMDGRISSVPELRAAA